jgi:hypothetical protein
MKTLSSARLVRAVILGAVILWLTQAPVGLAVAREKLDPVSLKLTEYLVTIPEKFLEMIDDETGQSIMGEERLRYIQVNDAENGYLKLAHRRLTSEFELALFKREKKAPLIGLIENGVSVQSLRFLVPSEGWKDLTTEVIPQLGTQELLTRFRRAGWKNIKENDLKSSAVSPVFYKLPRRGRDIIATIGLPQEPYWGRRLFVLRFDGKSFVLTD